RTELSRGYGAFVLQRADPVVAPAGEARANHDVFAELCRRTGVARAEDPETAEAIGAALLRSSRRGDALARDLDRDGIAYLEQGPAPVQFVDVSRRTDAGKTHPVPGALDREAPPGLSHYQPEPVSPGFPLALISPGTDRTISSTLGELHRAAVPVSMHPA